VRNIIVVMVKWIIYNSKTSRFVRGQIPDLKAESLTPGSVGLHDENRGKGNSIVYGFPPLSIA
jgi:hypothetical protein